MGKFHDPKLKDPRDVVDILWQQPISKQLLNDISEPDAINKILDFESMAWNAMS